jgi:hypothetical protein
LHDVFRNHTVALLEEFRTLRENGVIDAIIAEYNKLGGFASG